MVGLAHAEVFIASVGGGAVDVVRGLREGFYMLWDTLWALVLGFGLSGAIQAFVSRDAMRRSMGDHRPGSVARASLYGMASSSCSYAASALSRSLVLRGADYLSAMVFMFASTNLVIELGLVLLVLMGWQFVAAEFVGGVIMIVLLVIFGALWLRGRVVTDAIAHLDRNASSHHHGEMEMNDDPDSVGSRSKVTTLAGWSDAAGYMVSDLAMLRREMAIGFGVAGLLSVLVPAHWWADVFVQGHGTWTILENVAVGPFVAIVSFVCSVGNIPLAAALWRGGISFGGVIAFVFADLLAFPLLMIYRKQYGTRLTLRMLWVFWLVMSLAGLATEYLFRGFGAIPPARHGIVVGDSFRWGLTTYVNIVALVVFGGLYWLYRHRERFGGGVGYAKDVVCAMQVEIAHAPASTTYQGQRFYFCSEHCLERFNASPERFLSVGTSPMAGETHDSASLVQAVRVELTGLGAPAASATPEALHVDPVCGMSVSPASAAAQRHYAGRDYFFCAEGCATRFDADPQSFLGVS